MASCDSASSGIDATSCGMNILCHQKPFYSAIRRLIAAFVGIRKAVLSSNTAI